MADATPMDWLRAIVVLVLTVSQLGFSIGLFGTGGSFDAQMGNTERTLVEPARYAFIIWAPIYLSMLAFGIYQVLPSQLTSPLLRKIGWFSAIGMLGNDLWLIFAILGGGWPSVIWGTVAMILVMLGGLGAAFVLTARDSPAPDSATFWLVEVPHAIYTGWLSVAWVANLLAALKDSGAFDAKPAEATAAIVLLVIAAAGAVAVQLTTGYSSAYTAAVLWGLIAIVVASLPAEGADESTAVGITALILAAVVCAVYVSGVVRQLAGTRPSFRELGTTLVDP